MIPHSVRRLILLALQNANMATVHYWRNKYKNLKKRYFNDSERYQASIVEMEEQLNDLNVENWKLRNKVSSYKVQIEIADVLKNQLDQTKQELEKVVRYCQRLKIEKEDAIKKLDEMTNNQRLEDADLDQLMELYGAIAPSGEDTM